MKVKLNDIRVASLADLDAGTIIRTSSSSYTGLFNYAIVVDGGDTFEGKGILLLDGEHALSIIIPSSDNTFFRVAPSAELWVDGIDELQKDANSNTDGALVISVDGPMMRAKFHHRENSFGERCYVDMKTWQAGNFDAANSHQAYANWNLITADAKGRNETIILEVPLKKSA